MHNTFYIPSGDCHIPHMKRRYGFTFNGHKITVYRCGLVKVSGSGYPYYCFNVADALACIG